MSIAGVVVKNQIFSAVTQESAEFVDDPTDGILGLAFPDISNLQQVCRAYAHRAPKS